jgi:hypothetical protein
VNKIDLVAEKTVYAWRKYFEEVYPELHIATFSCFPRDENLIDDTSTCKFVTMQILHTFPSAANSFSNQQRCFENTLEATP